MATVIASKPAGPPPKIKKPSIPYVQTNSTAVQPPQPPSSSPSSATKRLPGQNQAATPVSAISVASNNAARPNRRLQRLSTRNTADTAPTDRKNAKKYPEPYVAKESHVLKKFKGRPPSLIVHLHPTHFRFDQQDGSFSYHSEMRVFIEHLQKGTIPHDMVEEFRKSDVQYYDGWLIVRVIDHRNLANAAASSGTGIEDGKPFSIHNYNPYITPSPYAPFPTKEQTGARSPPIKQEHRELPANVNKDGQNTDAKTNDGGEAQSKPNKPQPKAFHVALRPTILSRHMDLVLDAMAPDPKALNRKQSQVNINSRPPGAAAPPTPITGVPPTPVEKGPPPKKQKTKIDPKDLLEYEARVVNATAPPLYLDAVNTLEEAEWLIQMMRDPQYDAAPPSPKSRKRTVAELAADDAHAKQQERFMLIMDERNAGGAATNAAGVDGQAGAGMFQPRFEKFNALENIKREIQERKQREKDRQLQEDEARRRLQEQQNMEEEKKRMAMLQQRKQEAQLARMRQSQDMNMANQQQQAAAQAQQQQQHAIAVQRQHAQAQALQRQQAQQVQASSIPPNMQSQIMAGQAGSSPVVRQGTPLAASSPIVNNMQVGAQPMAISTSQQGHGSPPRPESALQHGHPGAPMARIPSGQGPSRNGTPQIPHSTPGVRTATPIVRQGTPGQHMTQASPHGSMVAPTPQMGHAGVMPGQMPNGMPMPRPQQQMTAQQVAELHRRHALQQQAAMQQMQNGTPQMSQAQIAHIQAQQHAQADRQAAIQRHQAQQAQAQAQQQAMQQQAMQQQQGTPQPQHMGQSPAQSHAQSQAQYNQSVADQMRNRMKSLQQGQSHGSPGPNHMTPQQQAAQMAQIQQQQRMVQGQQQMGNMGAGQPGPQQQRVPNNAVMQTYYQQTLNVYTQRFMQQAAGRYGGNTTMLTQNDLQQVQLQAQKATMEQVRKRQAAINQQAMARQQAAAVAQQQQPGGGGMQNGMGMNMNMNMGMNANVNPNMAAALQQQQAQQMQQLQLQHAQAQMMAAQQQQQQGGGAGGMAGMQQYQQQLQNMQHQQQQQGPR